MLRRWEAINKINFTFYDVGKKLWSNPNYSDKVRKKASKEAAHPLSRPETAVVTRQLCHSMQTDDRYYQALSGPSYAAEAFIMFNRMRQERKKLKPSSHALATLSHTLATPGHTLPLPAIPFHSRPYPYHSRP